MFREIKVPEMPRYRFNWANFNQTLLSEIAQGLSVSGDPVVGLKAKYGLRPKEDFIQDGWQVLLTAWLKSDSEACADLAAALRKRGLGPTDQSDDLAYLQACRNSQGLRQEALQVFLGKGEQSKGAIARPADSAPRAEPPAVDTAASPLSSSRSPDSFDRESLISFAKEAVSALYGVSEENVYVDGDGDILAPCGSAAVFVSVVDDNEFRVFSLLLRDPRECDELYRVINDVNSNLRLGRLFYSGGIVILEHNLPARYTTFAGLKLVIDVIGDVADFYDHRLQEMFGGSLFLRERAQDEISV